MITISYGFAHGAPRSETFRRADAARAYAVSLMASPRLRFLSASSDDSTFNIQYDNFNN